MASDFEQFMNRMLGQAMPQAPQVPVAPTPQPMMPTPQAPAQSAYSSPMPAQLAQLIERAAQMAQAQRPAPQTDNQFYTQALQSQGVDPRATASTAPVQGPTAPVTQPTAVSQPVRQAEPTGYLLVQLQPKEGDQGMQGQMVLVPMGTGYKVPDSVTVVGNGDLITDPVGIERAREGGMLLEQQAPEVQAQFTTANEQTQFRGDAATNAERERINRGEIANAQAIQDRSAFDDAEPVEVFTTEELKNSGVPELVQLGTQLEASGYTEYSTDQDVMVEPSSGKITLQPKVQEAPVEGPPAPEGEPVGTPLEALTPQKIRDMEGQTMFAEGTMSPTLVANEMQRQKITEVPDGTMLVVDAEGNLSTPAASETAPQGSTIILYGGESTRPDPSILGSPMEAVSAVGDLLDASRRKAVELTSGALTSKPVEWWVENVTSPVWNALLSDEAVEHFMTEVYPTITAPIAPLALQSWIANNPEKVAEVEQNGWDADDDGTADYTGDEAIWEAFIDEQPAWARVLYDLEMDPLNWATGGGNIARLGARELLTNPNVTRRISGEALDIVGRILRSPDVAVDKIIQGTGLAIKNTLGTVPIVKLTLDTLTSPTVQSAVSRATRPVQQATEDVMAFLRQAEGGAPPAGTTPTDGPTPPPIGSRPPTDPRSPTGGTINDLLNQVQRETDLATSGTAPRSATRDPLADIEGAAEQAGVPGPPEELFPRRTPREATDLPGDNPLIRTQNAADQAALDVTREQQGPRTIADMIREASEFGQRQAPTGPSVADPFEGTTLGDTIQQADEEVTETILRYLDGDDVLVNGMLPDEQGGLLRIRGRQENTSPIVEVDPYVDTPVPTGRGFGLREEIHADGSVTYRLVHPDNPDAPPGVAHTNLTREEGIIELEYQRDLFLERDGNIPKGTAVARKAGKYKKLDQSRRSVDDDIARIKRESDQQAADWGVWKDQQPQGADTSIRAYLAQLRGDAPSATLGDAVDAANTARPNWEFASPQDGAGRMVDEVFAQRQAHAREVAEFTRVHDPKARRFVEDQRIKRQRSMDTKAERGGQWDREHSRQEVIDEGRYIVDEFIPDFQATMRGTDAALPEYKFRQEARGNGNLQNQTDEYLLEQLSFGPDRYTRGIRNILRDRIANKGDATLQRYWDEAEAIRTKNQNLRSGMEQTPLPDQVAPEAALTPEVPTEPVFRETLYHGSPRGDLTSLLANPPARQYDNATSRWGAFFSRDRAEAQRYAGDAGRVYETEVALRNPYEMEYREFNYFQDITKNADGSPASDWAARQLELNDEAIAFRNRLLDEGHDGVVVRKRNGDVMEVAAFNDVTLPNAPAADVAPDPVRELRRADVDWAEIQPQDAPVGPERNLYFDDGEVHQVRWDDQLNSWRATIGTDRWTDDIFDQGGFATRLEAEDAIAEQLDPGALVANAPDAWNDLVSQSTPLSDLPYWERSAIEDYESSGFAVNGRLRASEEVRDSDLKTIWPLDIATARTELPGGTTLYRASNDMRQGIQVSNLNPGDTFTDKGFMSTSTKQRRAEVHQTKDGVLFRITTEPGLTGRIVDAVTKVDQEVILPRGTQFTVTGTTQGRKGRIIDLRARPGERGPDVIANADDSWAKSNIELARGYASESAPYDGSTASLRRVLGKPDTVLSDAVAPNDPAMTPEPEPPRPAPEPEVPVSRERARAESRYQRLPIAEVRETTNMSDEALEAVGLFPSQFRRQKFSEQTADSIHKRKRVNMPPVQVMRGTDGELYVLDGHSRLEGLRRRGDTDVDVQIVEGTRDELEEAAKTTNLSTTTHGPMGYADRARELADEGMSYDEIARELRQGNENWGKAGKQKAIDYHSAAFLPEDLATMFDQGTIPLNQAGELGRAIQDDVMTPAELQSFYTNVVVPEKLTAVDIRGEIARAAERKAGNNITGQRNALGFTDEELGSSGFWQGRAEEARIHKLIRKEEQNVRKWDERAKRPGTSLSASQKVDRQKSINRIAELRRELEPAPAESAAPALPPTPDDILSPQGPSDVMRDSGAQPLFFQNDPKRGARNMFERTPGPLKVLTKPAPRRSGAPQAPNRFVARDESALSTTEFSGVQIGQHNWRILNERFSNGDTYGDRWLKHVADVKDEQVARQADLSADAAKGAELTDAEAFEKAAGRVTHEVAVETLRDKSPKAFKAYQDEFTRLTTRKKDPIKDEWVARLRAFNHATANDSWWITRKYDYLLGMIREVILNNPITVGRYGLVNMLGNSVSAMLNDQPEIIGRALSRSNVGSALRESAPNEFVTTLINDPSSIVTRMFKYGHAQVDEPMTVDGVMSTIKDMGELPSVALHSPTESFAARMELGPQRHGVNTILRDQTTESVENPTKWANMVDSMRLGRHKVTPGTGGKLTGWIATRNGRDLANAMDVSFRTATWQSTMAANVAEGRTAFRDLMLQDLPRGADQARFNQLWDQLPNEFGPTRIREDFAEFGTNYADRMARDWTNAVGKMDENAREQVRRIFFSGDLTTADAYASRLILFHFWASRATPMYMKQLASHPGYMNAYIKLMESLEEQAQSGQYGKSVDGLLWLMKTPIGFNLFGRPDALFQTILSFGTQGNDFSPEGESGVAAWMRNSGLYFNPLIDFAFNMAGYQGDTFAPDPLALYNQRNLVITAWDLAKAHGWVEGDMPTPDMQAEFLTWMRSHTSGMLPGTVNIPDTDTTLYAQQQINYLIQDVAEERGLDPVGPEAVAAMNDPESELYQEAFRRYADAGGLRLALKILTTSVLYPRLRIARPDEIRYELTDPNITEERKDELYDQRAVARAGSNESRNLEVQQDEYYDLGTPEQQEAYSTYEDIRQGTLSEPVTINGVRINGRVLEDLSDDERSNAANLWASQNGQTENVQAIRDERKAYRESHPKYDGFVKWRSDVYDNPDGVLAWWQDTVEGNPNAERWLESLEPLPQDELTRELTSIEAYMQWAGIRPTTYDADPLATRDMSSVPYSATEGSGNGGQQFTSKEKDPVTQINDQLTGYQQDMALYESQVAAVFGQPVSMQNLPPNVRSSYEMILADHGIRPPSLGTEAGDYIRWRNAQRPGTDTSVNAYVNWQQQWMGNTNAAPATTTTTTPP